jgi:hypothetical protein
VDIVVCGSILKVPQNLLADLQPERGLSLLSYALETLSMRTSSRPGTTARVKRRSHLLRHRLRCDLLAIPLSP